MDARTEAEGRFRRGAVRAARYVVGYQWVVRGERISRQMHEARGVESKGQGEGARVQVPSG